MPNDGAHASPQPVCVPFAQHLGGNHGSPARARWFNLPVLGLPWWVLKQERLKATQKLMALGGAVVSYQMLQRKRCFKAL